MNCWGTNQNPTWQEWLRENDRVTREVTHVYAAKLGYPKYVREGIDENWVKVNNKEGGTWREPGFYWQEWLQENNAVNNVEISRQDLENNYPKDVLNGIVRNWVKVNDEKGGTWQEPDFAWQEWLRKNDPRTKQVTHAYAAEVNYPEYVLNGIVRNWDKVCYKDGEIWQEPGFEWKGYKEKFEKWNEAQEAHESHKSTDEKRDKMKEWDTKNDDKYISMEEVLLGGAWPTDFLKGKKKYKKSKKTRKKRKSKRKTKRKTKRRRKSKKKTKRKRRRRKR